MNNLEGIPLKQVVSASGESYLSFRKTLVPKYDIVWLDIFLGYFFLASTMALFMYIDWRLNNFVVMALLVPVFGIVAGFWIAFIQLFIHEASHFNIHPDKKLNDVLANIFLGAIAGLNIEAYRATHWKHHQNLGHVNDTENSYFNSLTPLFVIRMITGLHVLFVLKNRQRVNTDSGQTASSNKKQKIALLMGMLLHLAILALLFLSGLYFTMAVWISAMGLFFPFFATMRQLLEHRDEKARKNINFYETDHGKVSRLFSNGPFAYFFGGAGFNRHLLHHFDPAISYTRLSDVEKFLSNTPDCGPIIQESKTTYLTTFLKLIK